MSSGGDGERPQEGDGVRVVGVMSSNQQLPVPDSRNPMLNPVVLCRFFELCELSDLRNFRSVSKEWYSLSLSRFRKEARVNIHHFNPGGFFDVGPGPVDRLQWKNLRDKLDIGSEHPYRNFRLHDVLFFSDIRQTRSSAVAYNMTNDNDGFLRTCISMEVFWANYGAWLHKLELKNIVVEEMRAFKRVIFERTPNLEEFSLRGFSKGRFNRRAGGPPPVEEAEEEEEEVVNVQPNLKSFIMLPSLDAPVSWSSIFAHFPNIQKFGMRPPKEGTTLFLNRLERLGTNPHRVVNQPISELILDGFVRTRLLAESLFQLPFVKLEKLDFDLGSCTRSQSVDLLPALQRHGQTLKEFSVRNYFEREHFDWGLAWSYDNFSFQVDPFPSLTKLVLRGIITRNLHFLEQLPSLAVLRVEQYFYEKMLEETSWERIENLRLEHVEEFCFTVGSMPDFYLSEEIMESFVKIMPNVRRFTAQLANSSLRVVCRNWKDLWKLEILSGWNKTNNEIEPKLERIDDEGVTGIVAGSEERLPSIADLQNLRYLTLEQTVKLTEASIFHGFLKLPHIFSLKVCFSNEVSYEGFSALYGHMPRKGLLKTYSPSTCTCNSTCPVHGAR